MKARTWSEKYWSDPERARVLAEEGAVLDAADTIIEYMNRHQVSRTELADRLRMKKSAISRALNGGSNMTLRTLGRLAWGIGMAVEFSLVPARTGGWQRVRLTEARVNRHWKVQLLKADEPPKDGTGVAA